MAPGLFLSSDAHRRELALLYPNPLFETKLLGETIGRRAAPGDRLHVFGSEGALFLYSGVAPATRHTLSYALTLFPKDESGWRDEMAALEKSPPRFVVFSTQPLSTMIGSKMGRDYRDAMIAFLAKGYVFDGSVAVRPSPDEPVYERAEPAARPVFDLRDRLLLFERR